MVIDVVKYCARILLENLVMRCDQLTVV